MYKLVMILMVGGAPHQHSYGPFDSFDSCGAVKTSMLNKIDSHNQEVLLSQLAVLSGDRVLSQLQPPASGKIDVVSAECVENR